MNYDWQEGDTAPPIATGATATISTSKDMLGNPADGATGVFLKEFTYWAVVTNTYIDGNDEEQTATRRSEPVTFTLYLDTLSAVLGPWQIIYQSGGFISTAIFSPILILMSLLFLGTTGCMNLMMPMLDFLYSLLDMLQP